MKFIKREYPIVERCEFAIYLERRLTKHGDSELVVFST